VKENESIIDVGVVVIGRNEGDRLVRCLKSLENWMTCMVYVDSGSTDKSVEEARAARAFVVELDTRTPITAARARNEGVDVLLEHGHFRYVQFVDGDCEMDSNWIVTARQYLEDHPDVAAVGGHLRESYPERSIYNRLCAIEWNIPAGETMSIGGIGFYRLTDFLTAGKFDPFLIAGEEPELCLRLRQSGRKIMRIRDKMANHDANITSFRQWWKRMRRGGYGGFDVVTRLAGKVPVDEIPFYRMLRSARAWTLHWFAITFLLALLGALISMPWGAIGGLLTGFTVWLSQAVRIGWRARHRACDLETAMLYGLFTLIGKWAQLIGLYSYRSDLRAGSLSSVIKYKEDHDPV
jgi:glycosyltransferase involved in cell wall biosynthesis